MAALARLIIETVLSEATRKRDGSPKIFYFCLPWDAAQNCRPLLLGLTYCRGGSVVVGPTGCWGAGGDPIMIVLLIVCLSTVVVDDPGDPSFGAFHVP